MLKLPLTVVFCLFVISTLTQGQASTDLDELLRQADARRQEYVDSFRNLTSVETRVTELFDTNGRPTKRRTVISDFLVYQSELNGEVSEYRVAREVDGRTVGNPAEDGLLRSEVDTLVSDQEIPTAVVVLRLETDYEPSAFGLMTPKQIVVFFFDKSARKRPPDPVHLVGKVTITYEAFKRFEVTTDSDVHLPSPAEP